MNPYEQYNQSIPENPYDELKSVSDGNQRAQKLIDLGAESLAYGEGFDSLDNRINSASIPEIEDDTVRRAGAEASIINRQVVESTSWHAPELLPTALEKYQANMEQQRQEAEGVLRYEIANIRNTPGSEGLTQDEVIELAIRDKTKNMYAKILDEQGGVDFGLDMLNMVLIPDESYNWSQLADKGNWFTSYQSMEEMAKTRANLPPMERIKFDEELGKQLEGLESSEIQQFTTFLALYGEDPFAFATQAAEKVELATLFTKVGSSLVKGLRTLNKAKQLAKIGDVQTASVASHAAGANPDVAKAIGMPQADAAISGTPLKEMVKDTFNGSLDVPSGVVRQNTTELHDILKEIDEVVGLKPHLSESELRDVAAKWKSEVGDAFGGVKVERMDDQTLRLTSETNPDINIGIDYVLDDLGGYVEKESSMLDVAGRWVISPKARFDLDKADLVEAPVLGEMRTSKAANLYTQAITKALKPIRGSKASMDKVNRLLLDLNGKDVDTSRRALVHEGVGGIKLTEKEYQAWKGVRDVFDHAYNVNDSTMRREMQLRNIQHVALGTDEYYVHHYDTLEKAVKRVRADESGTFYALEKGENGSYAPKIFKPDELDELYGSGKRLVEVDGDNKYGWFQSFNGDHAKYAVVDANDVKAPPRHVLNKVPNYVPTERDAAKYFVKKKTRITVNGQPSDVYVTKAWAKTEKDALAWRDKILKGSKDDPDNWEVVFDREAPNTMGSDSDTIRLQGGMYRGSRNSTGLAYAGEDSPELRNAFGALQRYTNYTADKMAMSEIRLVAKKRWYNDASLIDPRIAGLNWKEALGAVKESTASTRVKSKLIGIHNQISHFSRIPTESEQKYTGARYALAKAFDRRGKENIAKYLYDDGSILAASPVTRLKSGAFHMLLGTFNLSQFVVQFLGATVAAGANPVAFTKAVPKLLATSFIDAAGANRKEALAMIKYLRSKKLIGEGMEADWEFWNRSGYRESVLRTNGELDAAGNFAPLERNAVMNLVDKGLDLGTKPYQVGELSNMRVSFYTALEMVKKQRGKAFTYSDADLRAVVSRAENYRLNMSNANKADYQKGLASLPTQFKSIYTKFAEVLVKDWFSPRERAGILAMQVGLYGATGVPILNHFSDAIADAFTDENSSPAERTLAKRGAMGWAVNDFLDIDAAVSGRVAVAGDLIQEMMNLFDSDVPAYKTAIGASFTTGDRAVDFINNMMFAGRVMWEAEDLDATTVSAVATLMGQSLLEVPTSTRRAVEAYYLYTYNSLNVGGRQMWQFAESEVGMEDVIARAFGFSSQELEDVYNVAKSMQGRKEAVRAKAQMAVSLMGRLMYAVEDQDEVAVKHAQLALNAVMGDIKNGNDVKQILEQINKELQGKDFRGRTYQQWIDNYNSELLDATGRMFIYGQNKLQEDTQ